MRKQRGVTRFIATVRRLSTALTKQLKPSAARAGARSTARRERIHPIKIIGPVDTQASNDGPSRRVVHRQHRSLWTEGGQGNRGGREIMGTDKLARVVAAVLIAALTAWLQATGRIVR